MHLALRLVNMDNMDFNISKVKSTSPQIKMFFGIPSVSGWTLLGRDSLFPSFKLTLKVLSRYINRCSSIRFSFTTTTTNTFVQFV